MNTTTLHAKTLKVSVETACALLDDALEAEKKRRSVAPVRKRAAPPSDDGTLPVPPEPIAESQNAVQEQE